MKVEKHIPGIDGRAALEQFVVAPRLGVAINRYFGRRNERDRAAAERTVDERLLPVRGCFQHIVADLAERNSQVEAGRGEMVEQRGGEWTVLAVSVERRRSCLGGKCDQCIGVDDLDLGQAPSDRPAGDRSLHAAGERIFPARIENDEPQSLHRLQDAQQAIHRNGLVLHISVALEDRIDRDQIVGAVHFDAVSGVINDRDIGVACDVRELANGATDHCNSKIRAAVDHVKAGIAQQLRDGGRVIDRIGQSGDVLIGGIADHQRNALVRKRAGALRDKQQDGHTNIPNEGTDHGTGASSGR